MTFQAYLDTIKSKTGPGHAMAIYALFKGKTD
jgi:hypothetical protein